jgi:hypothetical protein
VGRDLFQLLAEEKAADGRVQTEVKVSFFELYLVRFLCIALRSRQADAVQTGRAGRQTDRQDAVWKNLGSKVREPCLGRRK